MVAQKTVATVKNVLLYYCQTHNFLKYLQILEILSSPDSAANLR